MDMVFSCRKNAFFAGVHKIDAPISGPRIADKNFTDTKRIFLKTVCASCFYLGGRFFWVGRLPLNLDLRNPVALQEVEQLYLRVSR